MTAAEAFRLGFFERCAAAGMDPDTMLRTIEKAAALLETYDPTKHAALQDIPAQLASSVAGWGIPVALGAPWLVGGMAGYGAGRLMDISDREVDELKHRRLMAEYARQQELAEQTAQAREMAAKPNRRAALPPSMVSATPPPSVFAG